MFDSSLYYRLNNSFLGEGQSLDVINDGSGRIQMAATGDYSGQFWALVPRAAAKYSLHTAFLGDCFSLDVINDGTNDTPWLAPSGDFSGQLWELTPLDDGTYRLTNDFTGPSKALDTYGDSPNAPFLNTGDFSGQHWTLTPLSQIPSNAPIPALQPPSQGAALTEGPTDYTVCAHPVGSITAAMLFVDFANAPAGTTSASDTADHLLRGSATADDPLRGGAFQDRSFQDLYQQQSDGTVTIQVDVRADLGWRPMPQMSPPTSSAYDFHDFNKQKQYIADAIGLFSDIDLSGYPFVFVVAPEAAGFPDSPAFIAPPGQGVAMPGGGELRLAVTLGKDSYHNRFINLVHEVGHLFGLSDEYPFAGTGDDQVGCWSIMCDIFHSVSFLGWDRHKNGWLADSRKTYLVAPTENFYATLTPLSGSCGLSMVVVPVGDPSNPSKVFVVELAQPVLGTDNQEWGEGVLVYTVDATVATGHLPVVVLPKKVSFSNVYGNLYEAPYAVGDKIVETAGGTTLSVTVLERFGSSYNIKIDAVAAD